MKSEKFNDKKELFETIQNATEKYLLLMDILEKSSDDREEITIDAITMITAKCMLDVNYLNACYNGLQKTLQGTNQTFMSTVAGKS